MVIDSETPVREALLRVLALDTVRAESDLAAGLASLQAQPADVLIIDPGAPDVSGLAAIRQIRRVHPAVRIIAISGGAQGGLESYRPDSISTRAYLAACSAAGAHATLAKPFAAPQLRKMIDQVMAVPDA